MCRQMQNRERSDRVALNTLNPDDHELHESDHYSELAQTVCDQRGLSIFDATRWLRSRFRICRPTMFHPQPIGSDLAFSRRASSVNGIAKA